MLQDLEKILNRFVEDLKKCRVLIDHKRGLWDYLLGNPVVLTGRCVRLLILREQMRQRGGCRFRLGTGVSIEEMCKRSCLDKPAVLWYAVTAVQKNGAETEVSFHRATNNAKDAMKVSLSPVGTVALFVSTKGSFCMKKRNSTVKMILSALFLALTYVMPFLTGQIPEIGSMLSPALSFRSFSFRFWSCFWMIPKLLILESNR